MMLQLEGNVLRNLRPTMFQMLIRKNFQMCSFVMLKCPNVHDVQCSNVHDVVPRVTCDDTSDMWSQWCHTCNMWSHFSQEIKISTADQKVHLLSEHDQRIDLRGRR